MMGTAGRDPVATMKVLALMVTSPTLATLGAMNFASPGTRMTPSATMVSIESAAAKPSITSRT